MKKRLGVTLKKGYVNRVISMHNSGMIYPGNSDILYMLILTKLNEKYEKCCKNTGSRPYL